MKKIFMVSIMLFGILMFNNNVKAACGAGAYVGDELICLVTGATGGNEAGTAYAEDSTLVLNNYNGGNIKYFSGIGNPSKEEIKLIGDNYITSEDSYGILLLLPEISFIGTGTLTIEAKTHFLYYDWDRDTRIDENSLYFNNNDVSIIKIIAGETKSNIEKINSSFNNQNNEESKEDNNVNQEVNNETQNEILEENNQVNEETTKADGKTNKETKKDKKDIILLVSLGFSILCLIIVIVLVAENIKLKKKNVE